MLVLRLLVLCLMISGTFGFINKWLNFFNNCNPPETLLGKFCAGVHYYDTDDDGMIDLKDIEADMLTYNWDDDLCTVESWEMDNMWTCRYGYSRDFAKWVYPQRDANKDGVLTSADFNAGPVPGPFTRADFLRREYDRMKDVYCAQTEPRTDPIDIKLCAEVNELKPEDLKC